MKSEIILFLLSGTNLWTIVMYFLERRKRKLSERQQSIDVDAAEFDSLKKQLQFQEEQIAKFIENEKKRDELDDIQRAQIIEIKRCKHDIELKLVSVEHKLKIAESKVCERLDCERRIIKNVAI
ncbi:MAG: hypothetical protein PHR53_00875 [Bacteroidales bacterium]|nr:hypothetical protein [Bacteroidales bacterium]